MFTLQTLPEREGREEAEPLAHMSGFSLHAGVSAGKEEQAKREHLCRTIIRPAISEKRLSMTSRWQVRYQLKTPYRDGTTFVLFDPLDFVARLEKRGKP